MNGTRRRLLIGFTALLLAALHAAETRPLVAAIPGSGAASAESSDPVAAARVLVGRVLPASAADQIICQSIPREDGKDVFEIESSSGKIVLRGNNGVSIASALNWYLKYFCHCQVSWCGDQLNLPNPLPVVQERVRRVSPHVYRYAFNYCTFGYAMAFWDWAQWEREIDFMALNGINVPLAATGMEVVYRNVYRDVGLSAEAIDKFIAAPPYLPWFLMGNLDGWGGPNPASWYDRQKALQQKIMAREMELGMKPILPAFGGHVPAALQEKFPNAKIARLKSWSGFPGVHVLDPGDPLFRNIGARFVRESTRLYGTAHLYSADTFNEVDPPSTDPAYLKEIAEQVYQSMADADPQAVWFMQGWLFLFSGKFWQQPRIDALLSGVPDDKMVLLDLMADAKPQWKRTDAFAGKPWLWCIVHNWGGKQGMYGRLTPVGVELPQLIGNSAAGKLSGIGTTNEGNDVNPIVFDQFYEMAWREKPMEIRAWLHEYVWRRYGKDTLNAQRAWEILASTLYECRDNRHGPQGNFLAMPPSLSNDGGGFARASIFYDTSKVREAYRLLLAAADELGAQDTYRFDLVDLGRQVMSDIAQQQLHAELRAALAAKDAKRFDKAAAAYYEAIVDCDRLLRTHTLFQFGRYLQYPRSAGTTDAEKAQWERNARRLITLWGDRNNGLFGYAQRQYGGLMGDYNLACWKTYLGAISKSFDGGAKQRAGEEVRAYTDKWVNERHEYPVEAEGDPIAAARMIWDKYASKAKASEAPKALLEIKDRE